ncbi:MAG: superoxide dismutase [Candidatus Aenigmarchaeota archaeon CG_4_10_14_0_8_um_filter_37_24]|nr:superoxide dismutase [Candidatus Aenigmarchaeota archaeon]NCO97446.1 superoxide dismutase [Candidatus Aenigmarchaeota archaeon]PIZ34886.1 MAG: superoxide dismutase [Candidatus Aenigmarchaeota archaeon CG_4_10_14_0_8_um_filter_37_24]PJB74599.1 MAG: superoxide dismutase [Candidatus Aenigmarchaeota archaeon CG_4_9_14_3_um_filter_37_18]
MENTLPNLPYTYNALEPFIDEQTMKIHHTKHHQTYVDKLNAALEIHKELKSIPIEDLLKNPDKIPEDIRTAVINHGGGHANHSFFWPILKKDVKPKGEILQAIENKFGSWQKFKEQFSDAAAKLFGSGWAWLVVNRKELEIITTKNQDSPLTLGKKPLLCIDVWEHAYYVKFQNRRSEYIEAFFNVVNWDKVNEHYLKNR